MDSYSNEEKIPADDRTPALNVTSQLSCRESNPFRSLRSHWQMNWQPNVQLRSLADICRDVALVGLPTVGNTSSLVLGRPCRVVHPQLSGCGELI
jgi:hypothetical protein